MSRDVQISNEKLGMKKIKDIISIKRLLEMFISMN